ncbi:MULTISPECIES: recombination regulator RecX [unclassified Pseudomonas]|uniref:recombination regulator RecX n=1 Tax=Pseudomonas TaxID=286 RepID=UPI001647DD6D|nr:MULTISPECIES: recombination regulator RecX [unclassified Pseudomonas]MBC3480140.1 recombination regulator RecX [Pseudomonas sp. SWRI77]UVL05076.1 recombination regulator RecX [Pseudomonas sp. B21-047]
MSAVLDTPVAIRRTAMDLLARREHGRVELTRKLRQRGASDELIEPELDRLAEEGLLSEVRYLESFIRYRSNSGYGPARIREELGQRGLARGDIDQALRESGVDWAQRLMDVWQRKFAGQRPHDPRSRGQQTRFLAYRGFSMEMISRLLSGRDLDDY